MLGPKPCKEPVLGHDEDEGKEEPEGYLHLALIMLLVPVPEKGKEAYYSGGIPREE